MDWWWRRWRQERRFQDFRNLKHLKQFGLVGAGRGVHNIWFCVIGRMGQYIAILSIRSRIVVVYTGEYVDPMERIPCDRGRTQQKWGEHRDARRKLVVYLLSTWWHCAIGSRDCVRELYCLHIGHTCWLWCRGPSITCRLDRRWWRGRCLMRHFGFGDIFVNILDLYCAAIVLSGNRNISLELYMINFWVVSRNKITSNWYGVVRDTWKICRHVI